MMSRLSADSSVPFSVTLTTSGSRLTVCKSTSAHTDNSRKKKYQPQIAPAARTRTETIAIGTMRRPPTRREGSVLPLTAVPVPNPSPVGGRPEWCGGVKPFIWLSPGLWERSGRAVGSIVELIGPYPTFVDLHQFPVKIKRQPAAQVIHIQSIQLILAGKQAVLGIEQLLIRGGCVARAGLLARHGGFEQKRLGVVYLRVPQFHHPLLDSVQLVGRPELAQINPHVVGDVILE